MHPGLMLCASVNWHGVSLGIRFFKAQARAYWLFLDDEFRLMCPAHHDHAEASTTSAVLRFTCRCMRSGWPGMKS